jgi:hypothetical protein
MVLWLGSKLKDRSARDLLALWLGLSLDDIIMLGLSVGLLLLVSWVERTMLSLSLLVGWSLGAKAHTWIEACLVLGGGAPAIAGGEGQMAQCGAAVTGHGSDVLALAVPANADRTTSLQSKAVVLHLSSIQVQYNAKYYFILLLLV